MAVIETTGLTKRFGGQDTPAVLDGIDLSIDAGEVFGYLGPNGAGKTTTIRMLLGLMRPSEGQVRVFGEDPAADDALRARLGVLLENSGLDDRMTAFESLHYHARLYGLPNPGTKIDDLLDFVGLRDHRNSRVGTFSTGMKRKLGLARSIVHDPEILFLDEPSAGLDPEAQLMVRELLQELAVTKNMTVFLNSHHLDEVERLCTRIAILHRGRLRADDTVANLCGGARERRVQVRLSTQEQALRAVKALDALGLSGELQEDGATMLAACNGRSTPEIVELLVREGLGIEAVTRPIRSIEEVYFEIIRDEAADA